MLVFVNIKLTYSYHPAVMFTRKICTEWTAVEKK